MKKFKFLPPYKGLGKTNLPATKNRPGVYLIKENGKLVYIGMSGSNLYRTPYRHFEAWSHPYQEVTSYQSRLKTRKYTVRVVLCTPAQAARLERALIIKHQPRDNDLKYKGYQLTIFDKKVENEYSNSLTIDQMPF
jgi:excinuclease UvrABC nuclease subunit